MFTITTTSFPLWAVAASYGLLALIGYLIGSIPFGWILTRMAGLADLRTVGSGGTGATNVARVGGIKMAAFVMALDIAKGFAAAYFFGIWAGVAAVVGHNFPVWLRFKGGKGIATSAGFLMGASPLLFGICFSTWAIALWLTGVSSLSALIAMIPAIIFGFALPDTNEVGVAVLLLIALALWTHRENIKRLLSGAESKVDWKKKSH